VAPCVEKRLSFAHMIRDPEPFEGLCFQLESLPMLSINRWEAGFESFGEKSDGDGEGENRGFYC